MPDLGFDRASLIQDTVLVLTAFLLTVPLGWERGHGRRSVGFRTLPVVAMAACGFAIIIDVAAAEEAQARVIQGVITGVGFIGGGAIVKYRENVKGLVTAASIWNAGAIGLAVGFHRINIAIVLAAINLCSLWILTPLDRNGGYPAPTARPADEKGEGRGTRDERSS